MAEFTGNLEATSSEKYALVAGLASRVPYFDSALRILRQSGVRDRKAKTIERDSMGIFRVYDRDFRRMGNHGLVAALAADSLSDLLQLDDPSRNLFVTSALLHDATKKIEVAMMGLTKMQENDTVTPEVSNIFVSILVSTGVVSTREEALEVASKLYAMDPQEFIVFFDEQVNKPYLIKKLSQTSIPDADQKSIVKIAGSDSQSGLPITLARTNYFSGGLVPDSTILSFRELMHTFTIPAISGDKEDYLGLGVWYCDGITQGDRLVLAEERMREVRARGAYRDLEKQSRRQHGGISVFDVTATMNNIIERIFMQQANKLATVPAGIPPAALPGVILSNLQKHITG